MDIYHYDALTGEFLGQGKADPDPLQPDNWLIPAHGVGAMADVARWRMDHGARPSRRDVV